MRRGRALPILAALFMCYVSAARPYNETIEVFNRTKSEAVAFLACSIPRNRTFRLPGLDVSDANWAHGTVMLPACNGSGTCLETIKDGSCCVPDNMIMMTATTWKMVLNEKKMRVIRKVQLNVLVPTSCKCAKGTLVNNRRQCMEHDPFATNS